MFSLYNIDTLCNCINQYCSNDRVLTYFDSPFFFSTALHVLSIIAIPMHLFGAYCILFKTPERMISVKFSLLHLHFWTSLLDIGFSLLTTPFIVLPILAGYPLGLLNFTGMTTQIQTFLMMVFIGEASVAVVGIFENRYHVISGNQIWKKVRPVWYVINYINAGVFFLPVYYSFPEDQVEKKQMVLKVLLNFWTLSSTIFQAIPCLHPDASSANLFIMAEKPGTFIWVVLSEFIFLGIQTLTFFFLIYKYLTQFGSSLSAKTIKLQRKLMKTLMLQLALPIVIVLLPLVYCGLATWRRYHNQALNNLSFIIIASHGFFSTIAVLYMHIPYREEVKRLLGITPFPTEPTPEINSANQLQPVAPVRNNLFSNTFPDNN